MPPSRKPRDNDLIDALEASEKIIYDGRVWRVLRAGRDSLAGSRPQGRWDDGSFDVLYTAREADGALAEIYFHLMRGQPVFPSRMEFTLAEISLNLKRALKLADLAALDSLGVDTGNYGRAHFARRLTEYTRTQEIAETAHFLDFDGLIVPNARWDCDNVVIFTGRVGPEAISTIAEQSPVDWEAWKQRANFP
ncbi:MAG: RES family NAD+ phosphorylase [Rhodospirillales bacterium]|jgi:RES domain-containing protein|nr:RES family NAD+ phosphorylase [Rhodospirillales bacterium]MDP6645955.1 RES family NAD+ phosphorylase [Rhodospirillales bacterium]MDP6841961.1 RES family NAD+ phosphorylase [Rhodospirillales bacterium]|tara:strand:- start:68 stop:646 length:579 start_codon:yes stop_codon:yes gene_type:complete